MMSIDEPGGVTAHQLRLAVRLRGGDLLAQGQEIVPALRRRLLNGYRGSGRGVLSDLDVRIANPLNAMLYLDEAQGGSPLMPSSAWQCAAVREILFSWAGLNISRASRTEQLRVWDQAGGMLVRGEGTMIAGLVGASGKLRRSLLDAAGFPLIHRLFRMSGADRFEIPLNAGSEAVLLWLEQCYSEDAFMSSMTHEDKFFLDFGE